MIINISKPKNWTSFDVVAKLRSILKTKKVGHAGTLDPLAEGLLILLTGKDTKKQSNFMLLDKEYLAEIAVGAFSPTYDLECVPTLSSTKLKISEIKSKLPKLIKDKYIGKITQTVPAYSAKKVQGQPLYKKARKGKIDECKLPQKEVEINDLEIIDLSKKQVITDQGLKNLPVIKCKIVCSSGTYIRSIASNLGKDLGSTGVLISLVRTRIGDYTLNKAKTIKQIEEEYSKL